MQLCDFEAGLVYRSSSGPALLQSEILSQIKKKMEEDVKVTLFSCSNCCLGGSLPPSANPGLILEALSLHTILLRLRMLLASETY